MRAGVAAAVVGVVVLIAPGASSGGGTGARIAFYDSDRIYVINADGSGRRVLGLPPGTYDIPIWSDDGQRMAFSVNDAKGDHVYTADRDGRHRRRVLDGGGSCLWGDWAPNLRTLAFQDDRDVDFARIWVVSADGGGLRRLTGYWNIHPKWSPRGRAILHASTLKRGGWSLFVMDAHGRNRHPIPGTRFDDPTWVDYEWSPDRNHILLSDSKRHGLFVVGLGNGAGARRQLVPNLRVSAFDIAPDGQTVALAAGQIYVVGTDGTRLRRLTHTRGFTWDPQWSPDGRQILVTARRGDGGAIAVINADGSGQTIVAHTHQPGEPSATWVPPA